MRSTASRDEKSDDARGDGEKYSRVPGVNAMPVTLSIGLGTGETFFRLASTTPNRNITEDRILRLQRIIGRLHQQTTIRAVKQNAIHPSRICKCSLNVTF